MENSSLSVKSTSGFQPIYPCRIAGTGSYVPERIVTNEDLEKFVETSDEWIVSRTGIKERRIAAEKEFSSDMGAEAARRAIKDAGISPEDIGLIIVTTVTPDNIFPSTAARIQFAIGAKNAAGFDLEAACAGFVYGVDVGRQFVSSGTYENVLVVSTEKLSSIVDWNDRNTCVLFGDGAGAVVLRRGTSETGKILGSVIAMDGSRAEMLQVPASGCREPATHESVEERHHFIKMKGGETFRYAVTYMVESAKKVLANAGCTVRDIACAIPHQANLRIITAAMERVGLTLEQVFLNVEKYGNTSSASVAIALDEAVREGRVKRGDKILLVAFGSGFSLGSILLEW